MLVYLYEAGEPRGSSVVHCTSTFFLRRYYYFLEGTVDHLAIKHDRGGCGARSVERQGCV